MSNDDEKTIRLEFETVLQDIEKLTKVIQYLTHEKLTNAPEIIKLTTKKDLDSNIKKSPEDSSSIETLDSVKRKLKELMKRYEQLQQENGQLKDKIKQLEAIKSTTGEK